MPKNFIIRKTASQRQDNSIQIESVPTELSTRLKPREVKVDKNVSPPSSSTSSPPSSHTISDLLANTTISPALPPTLPPPSSLIGDLTLQMPLSPPLPPTTSPSSTKGDLTSQILSHSLQPISSPPSFPTGAFSYPYAKTLHYRATFPIRPTTIIHREPLTLDIHTYFRFKNDPLFLRQFFSYNNYPYHDMPSTEINFGNQNSMLQNLCLPSSWKSEHIGGAAPLVPTPMIPLTRSQFHVFPAEYSNPTVDKAQQSYYKEDSMLYARCPPSKVLTTSSTSSQSVMEQSSSDTSKESSSDSSLSGVSTGVTPLTTLQRHVCQDCNKSYSTYRGLSRHKQFHCTILQKKTFPCKYCSKVYVSLGVLKMHIRTHTLPCKCHTCGKAFSRPWLLQGHIRTHTGEKPFTCERCNRSFADRSNLRTHLQTHSEVKKYSCTDCSKTFSRKSLLLKHKDGVCSTRYAVHYAQPVIVN